MENSLIKALSKEENKRKFIEVFVGKVLQYKDRIDQGEEDFFMNKTYDDDLDNDDDLTGKVFEFKSILVEYGGSQLQPAGGQPQAAG